MMWKMLQSQFNHNEKKIFFSWLYESSLKTARESEAPISKNVPEHPKNQRQAYQWDQEKFIWQDYNHIEKRLKVETEDIIMYHADLRVHLTSLF